MNWKDKRVYSFVIWMVLLVAMVIFMPDLNKLTVEKGQVSIPSTSESEVGSKYLSDLNTNGEETYPFAIVFNKDEKLSDSDFQEIVAVLEEIASDSSLLIKDSLLHTDSEQVAEQLIAEDQTTVIAQFSIAKEIGLVENAAKKLEKHLKNTEIDAYITGSDLVISDFVSSTQEGVKKTEVIAVVFILAILFLIYRSPVVPVVSLLTVGISYIISLSIIGLLVDHFDFPFSNFTQVFLVVILFGIGTDYNILLFSRFKEELVKQGHVLKAISTTYQTAGKTVLYSGIAVFIGFVALYLAEFQMYQATSAVAIGVAVLLAVLMTLNPFFMSVFGFKMFWPLKEVKGHGENKLWGWLSKFAFMRPIVSLLFIGLVTIPFIYLYSNTLNYNDLVEIDDKYESKQAIAIIEDHYAPGFSSPVSLAIKGQGLGTADNLAELDKLANAIEQIDGVAQVYSVTRPEGQRIPELYLDEQSGTLTEGLTDANEGVGDISSGLSEANEKLEEPQDLSGVDTLINGTLALKDGAGELEKALQGLNDGLNQSTTGAGQLSSGLDTLSSNIGELKQGLTELSSSYQQLAQGFTQFNQVFDQSIQGLTAAKQGYEQIEALMTSASSTNPSMEVETSLQIATEAKKQLTQAITQLQAAKKQYNSVTASFNKANEALQGAISGAAQLESGANKLANGADELATGLQTVTNAAGQISNESSKFTSGLNEVNDGQRQLKNSLVGLQDQMTLLADGLKDATDGLDEIYDGLDDANAYLADLNKQQQLTFFIPQEVLEGEEFTESLAMYMNDDQTSTSMNIILEVNPYTEEAMKIVEEIRDVKDRFFKSTSIEADGYLTGKSMSNVDLQSISKADFIRSAIVMVIGIVLILLWVTRSLFQTVVIIASLMLANFTALGLTEIFTSNVLGHEALSWNVPFFTLIMIVTLGVDYSIFVMMRFNETKELGYNQILPTAKEMGGVILSAAVILGGTFAALIPSGIITLIQVAIAVIIGLVLLSIIIMPMLIPACFGLINNLKNRKSKKTE